MTDQLFSSFTQRMAAEQEALRNSAPTALRDRLLSEQDALREVSVEEGMSSFLDSRQQRVQEAAHKRREEMDARRDARTTQMGLLPGDSRHLSVNAEARVDEWFNKATSNLSNLPFNVVSNRMESGVPEEAREAFLRRNTDAATPEDAELLARREARHTLKTPQQFGEGVSMPPQITEAEGGRTSGLSNESRLEIAQASRDLATHFTELRGRRVEETKHTDESGNAYSTFREMGSFVDPTRSNEMSEELARNGGAGLERLKEALQGEDGEFSLDVLDAVSALAELAVVGGRTVLNNPEAMVEVIAEQAPQFALAAVSPPAYLAVMGADGVDLLRQGVINYQEAHDGQLPSQEEYEHMASNAFGYVAAMFVGDRTVGRALMPRQVAGQETRTGILASGQRIAAQTAASTVTEGAAEGYQAYAEGQATYNPADAFEIYEGAVLGAGAAGAISGGARLIHETVGTSEGEAHNATVQRGRRGAHAVGSLEQANAAVQSGDISSLLDANAETYNPLAAAMAIDVAMSAPNLSVEQRNTFTAQLGAVAEAAAAAVHRADRGVEQTTREHRANRQRALRDAKADLAAIEDSASPEAQELNQVIGLLEADIAKLKGMTAQDRRNAEVAAEQARADLSAVKQMQSRLGVSLSAEIDVDASITDAIAGDPASVERVITLAMANPDRISTEQAQSLLTTESVSLSTEQRTFLERFTESQAATHAAKQTSGVQRDIFEGAADGSYLGLNQYRTGIAAALQSGNVQEAGRLMTLLESFSQQREAKAAAAQQAFQQVEGTNQRLAIVPQADGSWKVETTIPTPAERKKSGALIIHRNSNTKGTLDAIQMERQVVASVAAELTAAVALHSAGSSNVATMEQGNTETTQQMVEPVTESVAEPVAPPAQEPATSASTEAAAPSSSAPTDVATSQPTTTETVAQSTSTPMPQERDLLGDLVDIRVEEAKRKRGAGKLKAVARAVQNTADQVNQANRSTVNAVTAWLRQGRNRRDAVSEQPLVEVENFLSQMNLLQDPEQAKQFLAQPMSAKQADLVGLFADYAKAWQPSFEEGLEPLKQDKSYFLTDFFQYLRDEDTGAVEENVWTAMSAAGFSWLTEQGTLSPYNTAKMIGAMFGNEDIEVTAGLENLLARVGTREGILVNQLGRRAAQALGMYALPDAPLDALSRLEVALGNRILAQLEREGLVTKTTILDTQLLAAMGKEGGNEHTQHYFYRVSQEPSAQDQLKEIKAVAKGTGSILTDLFGMESGKKAPSFAPQKYAQRRVKNTDRGVPKALAKILSKENQKAHYLREDTLSVFEALPREILLQMGGWVDHAGKVVHEFQEDGVIGKNESVERSLENALEFASMVKEQPNGTRAPFYFTRSMWKPQRVGIDENLFNPQGDKLHRVLVSMGGWQTEASFNNQEHMNDFWLAVGEGLGVKTDAMSITDAVTEAKARARQPEIWKGVRALARVLAGEVPLEGDNDAILTAVKAGKEKFHSLDALIGVAHYFNAHQVGRPTFTHALTREVDGKTNGPMLAMLMLGAGADAPSLLKRIAAGGFFDQSSGHTQVAEWAQNPDNQDLYKATARSMVKLAQETMRTEPHKARMLESVYKVTGALVESDGGITGEARDLVKTPITALMFGSGVNTVVEGMGVDFLGKLYARIEDALNGNGNLQDALVLVNEFLPANQQIDVNMTPEAARKRFPTSTEQKIRSAFENSFGEIIAKTLKTEFATFIALRDALNNAANTAYELYDLAYRHLREQKLAELMANDQIPYERRQRDGVWHRIPGRDLTATEEAAIREKLKPMEPVIHSAWSKLSEGGANRDNGIHLSKNGQKLSDEASYLANTVLPAHYMPSGPRSKTNYGMESRQLSPGVAAIILAIHSTDSYIASQAYSQLQALNVHDAEIVKASAAATVAKALNKATYEIMGQYSVADEITQALERSASGFYQLFGDLDPQSELAKQYKALADRQAQAVMIKTNGKPDWKWYNAQPVDGIGLTLDYATQASRHADQTRLESLAGMVSVDQYPMWDGNHEVSEDEAKAMSDLAAAAALRQTPQEILAQSGQAKQRLKGVKSAQRIAAQDASVRKRDKAWALPEPVLEKLYDPEAQPTAPSTESVLSLPKALVLDYLVQISEDSDLVAPLQQALNQQTDFNLEQALAALPETQAAAALDALQRWHHAVAPASVWGRLGPARIASDPELVNFFHQAGDEVPVRTVIAHTLRMLEQRGGHRTPAFYRELLTQLARAIPTDVTVTLLTPAHSASDLQVTPVQGARGWFTNEGTQGNRIFFLSPSFADSGLTLETVMHELVHAAVALQIDAPANAEVAQLVENLEALLEEANHYAYDNGIEGFDAALENVQEFVAWGMTNQKFQQEILSKVVVTDSRTNVLVTGMKRFIETLRDILFRGSTKSPREQQINGLSVLVANVSGILAQSQVEREAGLVQRELTLRQSNNETGVASLTSREIFEALPGTTDPRLEALLDGVVEKLHGPFGQWHAQVAKGKPLTALEMYQRAQTEGLMPFSSESLVQGFKLDEKQQFVLEQVELVFRESLDSDNLAYRELSKLWQEARKAIPDGLLTQAQHDFLFRLEGGDRSGRSAHLARFAALATVHPGLQEAMRFATKRDTTPFSDLTLAGKLEKIWNHILDFLHGRLLKVHAGQRADAKLDALMKHLVDAETKRQQMLAEGREGVLDRISRATAGMGADVAGRVSQAAQAPIFRNNRFATVRFASELVEATAEERLDHLTASIKQASHEMGKTREGLLGSVVTEVQGAWDTTTRMAHALLRETKNLERQRMGVIDTTRKNVLASFRDGGEHLTEQDKAAVTEILLRPDAASLLDRYTLADLERLVSDPTAEARVLEQELTALGGPHVAFYLASAKALGYFMATGITGVDHQMLNAHNIAFLAGTPHVGRVDPKTGDKVLAILDPLVSLYALHYSDPSTKQRALELIRSEGQREDGNGIEFVLKLYAQQKAQALATEFHGSPTLMQKGYTPELYNPYVSLQVVTPEEVSTLGAMGYQQLASLPKDPADPDAHPKVLMRIKDGGQARRVSGIFSTTGERAQGSRVHSGLTKAGAPGMNLHNAKRTREIQSRKSGFYAELSRQGMAFDPVKAAKQGARLVPVINEGGDVVNYRYMMSEAHKDAYLERDISMDKVLGALVGKNVDKTTSKDQNRVAMQALKDQYDAEYKEKPHSYVRIAADSSDPELKQHWDLLPEETKKEAVRIWGKAEILVRADLVSINFGYRKLRMTNMFLKDEEERNIAEKILVNTLEHVVPKAYLRSRQVAMGWEGVVTAIKDNVVIKNLVTLEFNILSNITLLLWHGVPIKDMVHLHREALEGAINYQKDTNELTRLEQLLATDYVAGQHDAVEQRILELKDALARNPAKDLIEDGLMPTIVDDVDTQQDDFSPFKNYLDEKTEALTSRLPETVRTVGKTLFMTHDTTAYKILRQSTQLSDFVARYTLYHYLTTRKTEPVARADAIQRASDMFVNYDVPTHKGVQWMNDMGFLMFTKYYLRIQRAIYQLYREQPARAMAMTMTMNWFLGLETIQDSWFTEQLRNPLRPGALDILDTWDEPILLKTALSPFR